MYASQSHAIIKKGQKYEWQTVYFEMYLTGDRVFAVRNTKKKDSAVIVRSQTDRRLRQIPDDAESVPQTIL